MGFFCRGVNVCMCEGGRERREAETERGRDRHRDRGTSPYCKRTGQYFLWVECSEPVYCVLFYFLRLDLSLHKLSYPKWIYIFFSYKYKQKDSFGGKNFNVSLQFKYHTCLFLLFVYLENIPALLSSTKEALNKIFSLKHWYYKL